MCSSAVFFVMNNRSAMDRKVSPRARADARASRAPAQVIGRIDSVLAAVATAAGQMQTQRAATLVLHASDAEFDFGFSALPAHHRYVGPLFWDPPTALPAYLESPGDPWVLVTLSSHAQDDLPIARAGLSGLQDLPVRVLLTLGEHVEQDLGPVPSNARLERYAPHGPVLERGF